MSPRAISLVMAALAAASPAGAQTLRTLTSERQLHGESALSVDVTYAAGRFRLEPAASGDLYRMEMRYDEDKFTPVREYDPDAGVLRLGLRSRTRHVSMGNSRRGDRMPNLDVALTPDVPLTLSLELGAVESDAEFGGLALRRLTYHTGASKSQVRFSRPNPLTCEAVVFEVGAAEFEVTGLGNAHCRRMGFHGGVGDVTIDFSGDWRNSAEANVKVAIGSLKLLLPRDLGVAISLDRFLASFDHDGFTKRGGVYYSDNFSTARYRLNLNLDAAFGGIEVRWLDAPR